MDPKVLLSKTDDFEEKEARGDIYWMVLDWVETHRDSVDQQVAAIATLLLIWNMGYYSRARRGFSDAAEVLVELFGNPRFQALSPSVQGQELLSTDLVALKRTVIDLYDCVDAREGLGVAGTSKVIHLLVPELFVMWDGAIC